MDLDVQAWNNSVCRWAVGMRTFTDLTWLAPGARLDEFLEDLSVEPQTPSWCEHRAQFDLTHGHGQSDLGSRATQNTRLDVAHNQPTAANSPAQRLPTLTRYCPTTGNRSWLSCTVAANRGVKMYACSQAGLHRGMHFTPDYPTSCGWPVRLPRRCWTISE